MDADLDARMAAIDPEDPEYRARVDAWLDDMRRNGPLPTLDDYRRVYASLARDGIEWPGDDRVRELYPVAP